MKSKIRALLGSVAAMLTLAAVAGTPAHAAAIEASQLVLMNESGLITDSFGSSQVVLATGSAVGGVGLIPAVDIYVVPNQEWAAADGQQLVDVSNAQHIPQTGVGFQFVELPLWLPYLMPGEWDVVIDFAQDGIFDVNRDQVLGAGTNPGFEVHFDGNRRVIDKEALKEHYAQPWAVAAAKADLYSSMVTAFQIKDTVTGTVKWFDTVSAPFSTTAAAASSIDRAMVCADGSCSSVDKFLYNDLEPAMAVWEGGGAVPGISDACQWAVDKAFGAGQASCTLPPPGFTSVGWGTQQLKLAAQNLHKATAAIYADPPDPNYSTLTTYEAPDTPFQPMADDPMLNAQTALANSLSEAAGRSMVILHAMERFDGAVLANDEEWAAKQADLLSEESIVLAELLTRIQSESMTARDAMRAAGVPGEIGDTTSLVAKQTRLADTGFTSAELDAYHAAGWTDEDIQTLKTWILGLDLTSANQDLATVLDEVDASVEPAQSALWSLAAYAKGIATAPPPDNQPPTASFTVTPTQGTVPLSVQVDASGSSDSDGTIASYAWDFGDGTPQQSGVSASHTYANPGTYTIALEVADNSGALATSTRTVEASPGEPVAAPTVAATVTGTVGLEGWYVSNVKVTWDVSGGAPLTTTGCEETLISQDTGGRTLTCTATNSAGTTRDSVTVKRDATAPTVTWLGQIQNNSSFPADSVPDAPMCSAVDTLSGAPGACDVSGYSRTIGQHMLTAQVVDLAGNHATATRTYFVNAVSETPGLYTLSGDFDRGVSNNVGHAVPDQLQLDDESQPFPFIWVALSARGTIAKIDTTTGEVEGEYSTTSDSDGSHSPSRTTVAADGSVWAGNRGQSSVIHVGNFEAGGCVDRNGNGRIDTSTGYGDVLPWPDYSGESAVSTATDECILHYVDTPGSDARHLSVDGNGDVWAGSYGVSAFVLLDGRSGAVKREVNLPCGGYGGLIDGNQVLWSSGGGLLLRWDPQEDVSTATCLNLGIYGVAFDSNNNVWASTYGSGIVYKVASDGKTWESFPQGNAYAQGLAVDKNDHIWISSSLSGGSNRISHLLNDGTLVGQVTGAGSGSTGVSIDADGKIWTANIDSSDATRIDPLAGPIGAGGIPVGAFDLTVPLDGASPYNYSDMTGSTLTGKPNAGSWTVVHDSGQPETDWGTVNWTADVPPGASLSVKVASSSDGITFGQEEEAADAVDLAVLNGRYLRVTVAFLRSAQGESPVLYDLSLETATPANNPPVASAGGPYTGDEGSPTPLRGSGIHPDDLPLTYAWSVLTSTGTDPGAACTFANPSNASTTVTCNDDGIYSIRLTVSDGENDVTSDAQLTIVNVAPSVTITSPTDTSFVRAAAVVTLTGTVMDQGSNDALTCTIDWGDGSSGTGLLSAGICTGTHTFEAAGIYDLVMTVHDDEEASDTDSISLVVYDQNTKVTGGGFIKLEKTGRTSFGFVAYEAQGVLGGQIQIRLPNKSRFHGGTVTALTVSGKTASWSGTGTINREGGYTYAVTVTDNRNGSGKKGTPDTVALTITDANGRIVNSVSGPLAGGNITVHK